MELICANCFFTPIPAADKKRHEARDMVVCGPARSAPAASASAQSLLCGYCGGEVWLECHQLLWYDL